MKVEFTIVGQVVSLKNNFRVIITGPKGKQHGDLKKSDEAKTYERAFRLQIPPAARVMFTGPLKVTIHAYYSWNGPDLECELPMDLMQAEYRRIPGKLRAIGVGKFEESEAERVLVTRGVYENDRQVREKHLIHHIDKANPRAEITVETIEPQQPSMLDDVPLLQTSATSDPF